MSLRKAGRGRPRPVQRAGVGSQREPGPQLGPDPDPESAARAILLGQLSEAARTRAQLERKLASRNVPEPVASAILDRFEEVQLINDSEFARSWVRSRMQSRGLARRALRQELSDMGVPGADAESALAEIDDEEERHCGMMLIRRKVRAETNWDDPAERQRQTRRLISMLARRGYAPGAAFGIVHDVVREMAGQAKGTQDEAFPEGLSGD